MDWTIVEGYFHFQLRENLYNFVLPSLLLACGSREPTSMNTLLNLVIGGEGVLLMILDSIPVVGTVPEVCAGCPVQAEVNQQIVDFAVSQLQGSGGQCSRTDVQVDNFQSQV